MTTVDDYLALQPPPARAVLERVRATLRKALPRATERISYEIPVLELDGVMVLFFAGHPAHYAIYPASERLIASLGGDLGDRLHGKATIRFAYDDVPARLLARIAKLRAAEVTEQDAKKKAAKKDAKRAPRPRRV